MNLREWLHFLQTGHGRSYYRSVWNYLVGPFLLYYFVGTWGALVWGASARGRSIWFALGHLPPSLVTLLAVLWFVVFIRERPRGDYRNTLVELVQFWTEFRKYGQSANDINHAGLSWTVAVPQEISAELPAGRFPGLRVTTPPRCPKCNLDLGEARFRGGCYWTCGVCNTRHISRESFAQVAENIEELARTAWKMSEERRPATNKTPAA
jgi:hypothetical protein